MIIKERLGLIKPGNLHLPAIITFIVLHLNHMLLTLAQYSNKNYTFPYSDPTILNYLEGYSNQTSIFEFKGYPTTNLQTYHPGPLPNIYIFKFSWLLHNLFDINPIYLSNILFAIYPTLLIVIATTILYKNKLKLLAIMTLSITWLVQYTNNNFNASNRGPLRLDTGTDYITLVAILTLMMVVLSYKKPNSSHLPLLAFSGILLNNHFTSFALAPFTILYALYSITISIKTKKYEVNYKAIVPISIFIYFPLIYRFLVEPLYLYNALKMKSLTNSERIFPDKWTYLYETYPLQLFINPCDIGAGFSSNNPCLSYDNVKISVIIFTIITLIVVYKLIKNQNIFVKLITIISFLLINYITLTGFEPKHSSLASAVTLSILIYYLSKNIFTTSLAVIIIILLVNYLTIGKNHYQITPTYEKIETENFTQEFIKEFKTAKYKIDICNLTFEENCTDKLGYRKKSILQYYSPLNMAHITILEMLKNKIDICIVDKTGSVNRLKNLICTSTENKDINRNELFLIRDFNFETPSSLYEYVKIATVVNTSITQCSDPIFADQLICENEYHLFEYLSHPGVGLYLRKDAKGLNPIKLSFLNNQVYAKKLTTLNQFSSQGNKCTQYYKDKENEVNYCYKKYPSEYLVIDHIYKDKADIYDPR